MRSCFGKTACIFVYVCTYMLLFLLFRSVGKIQTKPNKSPKRKKKKRRNQTPAADLPAIEIPAGDDNTSCDSTPCSSANSSLERPRNSKKATRTRASSRAISKKELKELQEHGFSFEVQMGDGRCYRLVARSDHQRDTWIEKLQKFLNASKYVCVLQMFGLLWLALASPIFEPA